MIENVRYNDRLKDIWQMSPGVITAGEKGMWEKRAPWERSHGENGTRGKCHTGKIAHGKRARGKCPRGSEPAPLDGALYA